MSSNGDLVEKMTADKESVMGDQNTDHERDFEAMMRSVMPDIVLNSDKHKGQDGRIGVIGGSEEYTGAPYFSAFSAMKIGADQGHVFCMRNAAVPIKCYSPELIVLPYLDAEDVMEKADAFLDKMECVIIGPGLGRDKSVLNTVAKIIEKIKSKDMPMVIDADGLWLVKDQPNIIHGYKHLIMTPNKVEADRLKTAVFGTDDEKKLEKITIKELSAKFGNVTIMQKGRYDDISNGKESLICGGVASARRCGGQGDLMSGATATYFHWCRQALDGKGPNGNKIDDLLKRFGPAICAAFAGSMITRRCNRAAIEKMGRSATTTDMINSLNTVMFCYSPGGCA